MRDLNTIRQRWTFSAPTPATEVIHYLCALAEGLALERDRLRELKKYAAHADDCDMDAHENGMATVCTCGLEKILNPKGELK